MKRTFLLIVIGSLVIMVISVAIFLVTVYPKIKEQAEVRNMVIDEVALDDVQNGTFQGDFNYRDFTYEIEVTVQGHVIEEIKVLRNRDDEYAKKAEAVIDRVLKAQSLKVDAITGATLTSKALLKSVENALAKGLQAR